MTTTMHTDQEAARREVVVLAPSAGGDDQLPLAPIDLSVHRALADTWLVYLADQVKRRLVSDITLEDYRGSLGYWFAYLADVARTDRPTPRTVSDYVISLLDRGLEPNSANAYLSCIKSLYRWAESMDLYPQIARSIRTHPIRRDGPLPTLTVDQVQKMFDNILGPPLCAARNRALVALLFATAARAHTAHLFDVGDIDAIGGSLRLRHKGRIAKDTRLPLAPEVCGEVLTWLRLRAERFGPLTNADPLWISLDRSAAGNRLTTRSISRIVLGLAHLSGFVHKDAKGHIIERGVYSTHNLRRAALVTVADAEGLEVAQGLAGHASMETTRRNYVAAKLDQSLRRAAGRLVLRPRPHA